MTGEKPIIYIRKNDLWIASTGGETVEQVQSDWNVNDENDKAFIKNKPEVVSDEEIIDILTQEDLLPAIVDIDGAILVDENDNILLW